MAGLRASVLPVAAAGVAAWSGYSAYRGEAAREWVPAREAVVEEGELFRWSGSRLGVRNLRYRYVTQDGRVLTGRRVAVGHPWPAGVEPVPWMPGHRRGIGPQNADVSADFVPGGRLDVYYDPTAVAAVLAKEDKAGTGGGGGGDGQEDASAAAAAAAGAAGVEAVDDGGNSTVVRGAAVRQCATFAGTALVLAAALISARSRATTLAARQGAAAAERAATRARRAQRAQQNARAASASAADAAKKPR